MRWMYGFLVFIGVLLFILPLAVPVIKTSAEFSMFNTKWNGGSEFAKVLFEKGKLVPILYPYNSIDFKREGILIIIGPDIGFSPLETEKVRDFLERGGTLFIADDSGRANSLLDGLRVKSKFSDKPLRDIFYSRRDDFPVVVRIEDPELSYGVEKVILNIPSVIMELEGSVFSSKLSIVEGNMKSYPILAEMRYGEGRIIMLSDPDILINDMASENKRFINNLVEYFGSKVFYLDEAHHSDFNPYSVATVYVHRELDREKAFWVFIFVATLMVFVESGILRVIARSIRKLLPRGRKENIFEGLPEGINIKILKKIVNEIKTGSKFSEGCKHEGARWKRIYRKAKRRS